MPEYITFTSVLTRMAILFIGGQTFGILLRLLQWPEMLGMIEDNEHNCQSNIKC